MLYKLAYVLHAPAQNNHCLLVFVTHRSQSAGSQGFNQVMEVTEEEIFSEEGKNSWQQPVFGNDGDKFVLGDWLYEDETNLFPSCQNLSFSGEEEVVEMEEAEILAEQRHLCSICGKEFRREGNVRIHMRSHGEQYKKKESLISSRPKCISTSYYSCPFRGCRYNKHHTNFKHLKSIVSVRNHYRRSHCAKMFNCNNCGKEFSFVGDLKIHGNKCGHETWRCWCSLTFSTRNKLLRHGMLKHYKHAVPSTGPALVSPNGEIDKAPQYSAQELNNYAIHASPILTEGSLSYDTDRDVLLQGEGLNATAEIAYDYERMESEVSLSSEDGRRSELYASLFLLEYLRCLQLCS